MIITTNRATDFAQGQGDPGSSYIMNNLQQEPRESE